MTEKIPKKDIIAILYITLLGVVALVYGFSTIPSPVDQRERGFDQQRVTHLGEIRYTIDETYRTKYQLPETLDIVTDNLYSPSEKLIKADPETKTPYTYTKLGDNPPSYKLCATFTTDSNKDDAYAYDTGNYNYSSFAPDFKHPKGNHCFTFTPTSYYPTPSMDTNPEIITYPADKKMPPSRVMNPPATPTPSETRGN